MSEITSREQPADNSELAIAELKFRRLFEAAQDGILLINADTAQIEEVNPFLEKLLGYTRDELLNKKVWDIGFLKDSLANKENFAQLQRDKYIRYYDMPLKTKDGTQISVEFVSNVYRVGDINVIQCNIRDMTEHRKDELALKNSEIKYRNLFEYSGSAIMLLNAEKFFDCNPATLKLFGCNTREEFLGNHPGQLSPPLQADGRDSRVAADDHIAIALKQGTHSFEWKHRRLDGTDFSAEVVLSPIDYEGQPVLQATVRDISERKRQEDRGKELEQIKNKFIQAISHQMRTPLGTVRWALEEMFGGKIGSVTAGQREILHIAYVANTEVINRIGDFLIAIDIEEGRIHLELEKTSLEDVARSVCAHYRPMCDLKKLSHQENFSADQDSLVNIDLERIRDMMGRLIDNAISYTREGGSITSTIRKSNGKAHFEITDTGIGLPHGEQAHAFQRFRRLGNAALAKPDGSGLGLFIAKSIVEAHGGTIGFTSEEGKGSTFWFELPLVS